MMKYQSLYGETNPSKRPEVRKKIKRKLKKFFRSNLGKVERKNRSRRMIGNTTTTGMHWTWTEDSKKKMVGNKNAFGYKKTEEQRSKYLGNKNSVGKNLGDCNPARRSEVRRKIGDKLLDRMKNHPGPYKDTKPELKMKEILDFLNIPYEDQYRVEGINHLVDLHFIGTDILIEVDGDYYHRLPGRRQKDYRFNRLAKKLGYIVLRFWEKDIMNNRDKVINKLKEIVDVR